MVLYVLLAACSNRADNRVPDNHIMAAVIRPADAPVGSGTAVRNDEQAAIYTKAIATYIEAVIKKDKTRFDTLFFGKHVYGQPDDFPDITLPETITGTHIRLLSPEAGRQKQLERKSLVYINMMGWVNKEKAEFILVTFSNGGEHQVDYYIDFIYDAVMNVFELDKIQFENYAGQKEGKSERIILYADHKYIDVNTGDIKN